MPSSNFQKVYYFYYFSCSFDSLSDSKNTKNSKHSKTFCRLKIGALLREFMDKNMLFMIFGISYGPLISQMSLKIVKIINIPKLFVD